MKRTVLALLTGITILGSGTLPALAHEPQDYRYNHNRYQWEEHPYVKKALIGGGGGAILGGLLASDGERLDGAITGALLGAGAGLGYEYLRTKGIIPENDW